MKKDTVWLIVAIVLLLGVVVGLVWIFGGFSGGSDTDVPDTTNSEEVTDVQKEAEVEEPEEKVDVVEEDDSNLGDVVVDSSVTYSTNAQSVGEDTEEVFTLSEIGIVKGESVMEIEYVFTGDDITEDSSIPVSATNKSSFGTMEIVVSNVSKDSTGMGFDDSKGVNMEGITRLTKVVSGATNTVKYNLGFIKTPQFHLYEPKVVGDILVVKFSIKYPGGEISTDDFGTTEFTSEDVSVESSTADNGVRISGYTYSATGGVLRYVYKTSTNTGSPIPSFEGSIAEGTLTVTFPSISTDVIYSASEGGTVSLPGGVTLNITRSGNQSIYEFVGVGTEYKLYGVTSPNQVIVEVKL
jgi:hypothetical protein